MTFKKKLQLRIVLSVLLILLGAAAIIFSLNMSESDKHLPEFIRGFYLGTGCGLVGAGIATIIKKTIILTNPEKFKKAQLEDTDERNKFILTKSGSITAFITLVALYAAILLTGIFFEPIVTITLLFVLGFMALTLLISFTIFKRTY